MLKVDWRQLYSRILCRCLPCTRTKTSAIVIINWKIFHVRSYNCVVKQVCNINWWTTRLLQISNYQFLLTRYQVRYVSCYVHTVEKQTFKGNKRWMQNACIITKSVWSSCGYTDEKQNFKTYLHLWMNWVLTSNTIFY